MQIFIVGKGKLATELLDQLALSDPFQVLAWPHDAPPPEKSIVIHAGSGRELQDIVHYCQATGSVLIELSTGSALEHSKQDFPVVICPNTNILMLKFMSMLAKSGDLFRDCKVSLTESHQAGKHSVPGTAVSIAHALGLSSDEIVSVRDPVQQSANFHIPAGHLARHALHQIVIEDGACRIQMEVRVYGSSPYADGVARIILAVYSHQLENRLYEINEFIEKRWL